MSLGPGWRAGSGARAAEDLDALAGGDRHDGALGGLALTHPVAAGALALALAVQGVHAEHLHVEDLLDRDLDLRLVGVRPDDERVLVLVQQAVALLRDDRGDQHVPGVADAHAFSSVLAVVVPSSVGAWASGPASATSASSAGAVAASSAVAGAASSGVAAAFLAGAFSAAAFLAGAGSAPVTVSTVPWPSAGAIDGTPPGVSWVARSGLPPCDAAPVRPATNSASAASVKTTSSATSTS